MNKIVVAMNDSDIARFWLKVDVRGPDECWPWLAAVSDKGYGTFFLQGKTVLAHNVAAFLGNGPPADFSLHTCHHCDNPPCCNPFDLFYGTRADNMRDAVSKHRHGMHRHPETISGFRNGNAKLTDEQVAEIRKGLLPRKELAAIYGVSIAWVGILQNGLWRKKYAQLG